MTTHHKMKYFQHTAYKLSSEVDPHLTTPNPRVGCVIMQNNRTISRGIHKKLGLDHAEVDAFNNLPTNVDIKKCEIYITLEPCDSFSGKQTPSCTELLIKAQPKKVYIGSLDPHFNGKNIEKLKSAGISVEVLNDGLHEKLNPFFKKHILTKTPYITLKVAQSLDGKITNDKKYITNKKSLQKVHEMRANYSAILTTTKTILADNPKLDTRLEENNFPYSNPQLIIVGKSKLPKNLNIWKIKNRKIHLFPSFQDFWKSDLCPKIDSIMTECGSTLNTYLLQNNFVNQINLFIAPQIIGGKNLNSFVSEVNLDKFKLKDMKNFDGDVLLRFAI